MKLKIVFIALFALLSTSTFAYSVTEHRSWGIEVKCDNGESYDIKQIDGQWMNPETEDGFETKEEAAISSCQE